MVFDVTASAFFWVISLCDIYIFWLTLHIHNDFMIQRFPHCKWFGTQRRALGRTGGEFDGPNVERVPAILVQAGSARRNGPTSASSSTTARMPLLWRISRASKKRSPCSSGVSLMASSSRNSIVCGAKVLPLPELRVGSVKSSFSDLQQSPKPNPAPESPSPPRPPPGRPLRPQPAYPP